MTLSLAGFRFKARPATSHIVVHCSATRPSQNYGAVDIDRMHRAEGYLCIGYHVVIKRDGTVEYGRPIEAIGAHAKDGGFNNFAVGVCLVGGVAEKPWSKPGNKWNGSNAECNFTPEQFKALTEVIDAIQARYGALKIVGHRDIKGVTKACPSFDVAQWLKTGAAALD